MTDGLHVSIRTPHAEVYAESVRSLRVPTETGLVGLRPGGEPLVLAVESGLVVMRSEGGGERLAATTGGLLESERNRVFLYTPYAVVGDSEVELQAALEKLLAASPKEIITRQRLELLERRIVTELAQHARKAPTESGDG